MEHISKLIFGCTPIQLLSPVTANSSKDMAEPINMANLLPILVIILCILLGVALVGLTYCLNHRCIAKKKKNEVKAISRVEPMKDHVNEIEMGHMKSDEVKAISRNEPIKDHVNGIEMLPTKKKLPKVKQSLIMIDPASLDQYNRWLNPRR